EEQRIQGNQEAGDDAPGIGPGGASAGAQCLGADGGCQLLPGHGRGDSVLEQPGQRRQLQRLQDERRRLRPDAAHRRSRHEPGSELVGGRRQDHLHQLDRSGGAGRGLRDGGGRLERAEPDQHPEQRRGLCLLAREQQVRLRQRSRRRPVRHLPHDAGTGRADHGPYAPDHQRRLRLEPGHLPRRQEAGLHEQPRRRLGHLPHAASPRGAEERPRQAHQERGPRPVPRLVARRCPDRLRQHPERQLRGLPHEGLTRGFHQPARQPLEEHDVGRLRPRVVPRRQEDRLLHRPGRQRRDLPHEGHRRRQPDKPHQQPGARLPARLAAAPV
ncbi:MAG: tolB protein precursor, periplasmic protein involved in the tonb-independent uptake of group A colicins, partial [uncultured Rubrobacteraceae bacterium]